MNVFYAMNLGMLVGPIGDLGLKILVIRRFELALNDFHFRRLKNQHIEMEMKPMYKTHTLCGIM